MSSGETGKFMIPLINGFFGEYRFLSNFYSAKTEFEEMTYPNVESAFQAAKTLDLIQRQRIRDIGDPANGMTDKGYKCGPGKAKREGHKLHLRADWESIKFQVMEDCLRSKFSNPDLRSKLLATGDAELIEGNTWGDTTFGQVRTPDGQWVGQNRLGKLLMKIREEIKQTGGSQ
jgi:ribA/ribD-fused uncharacterized protein